MTRGVTVAQVALDHLALVRIQAGQLYNLFFRR